MWVKLIQRVYLRCSDWRALMQNYSGWINLVIIVSLSEFFKDSWFCVILNMINNRAGIILKENSDIQRVPLLYFSDQRFFENDHWNDFYRSHFNVVTIDCSQPCFVLKLGRASLFLLVMPDGGTSDRQKEHNLRSLNPSVVTALYVCRLNWEGQKHNLTHHQSVVNYVLLYPRLVWLTMQTNSLINLTHLFILMSVTIPLCLN